MLHYLIITFYRQLTAPDGSKSRVIKFGEIEIQGGGRIDIESDIDGLFIHCSSLWIRSGGLLTSDRLTLEAQQVIIEQSGVIDLSFKVRYFMDLLFTISTECF